MTQQQQHYQASAATGVSATGSTTSFASLEQFKAFTRYDTPRPDVTKGARIPTRFRLIVRTQLLR